MTLVASLKLKPVTEQAALLRDTLERCNQACNFLGQGLADVEIPTLPGQARHV
jgi:hypothetical protein